jgi:fucose 4-O-acetylase-like acetyltransferase
MSNAPGRLDFLDNLKWFLTMLVIAHHSAIAFGASGGWYYVVPPPEGSFGPRILTVYVAIQQAFFMSLFFAISSYFLVPSFERKKARRFLQDRAKRLGIPLVVYFFVLNPTLVYMTLRFEGRTNASWPQFMAENALSATGVGPLWFVETLLIFALVYAGIRWLRPPPEPPRTPRPLPSPAKIAGFILLLTALTYGVRIVFPVGEEIAGLQLAEYPLYVALFLLGVFAYRHHWLDHLGAKTTRPFTLAACVAIAVLAARVLGAPESGGVESTLASVRGGFEVDALLYAFFQVLVCVGLGFFFLRLFRARWNHSGRLSKNLTRAAYAAYIVHPFFVITGTALIAPLPGGPLFHFALLVPFAITTTFAASHVLRQLPGLRAIL